MVIAGGLLYIRGVKPDYEKSLTAVVKAPTEIWRDSAGIAHVWAQNDTDMYFAQGYAHAQERLSHGDTR